MTRFLFLLTLLILLPRPASCQDGLVLFQFGDNRIRERAVQLYARPLDTLPAKVFAGDRELESNIAPYVGGLGNSSVFYRCAGETIQRWAIVEEGTEKIYWVAKDSLNEFVTWAHFWNTAYCVSGKPLHSKPADDSPEVKVPAGSGDHFSVIAVQGDWLYVMMGSVCEHGEDYREDLPPVYGWVRWRKGNEILVGMTMPE